jgi:serine protease Do
MTRTFPMSVPAGAMAVLLLGVSVSRAQDFAPPPPEPPDRPMVYALRGGVPNSGSFLGVGVAEINSDRAKALKLSETHGVELTSVEEDSPAAKAGLKAGDAVLEYNGQRVEGMEQFIRLVRETPAGREVKLLIGRNGATQTVPVTIGARKLSMVHPMPSNWSFELPEMPPMPDMPKVFTTWRSSILGIEGESLGKQLAEYFGVKEGVLVRAVVKDSPAEKSGIKAGDVIVKVDGTSVSTPGELSSAVRSARGKKSYSVQLMRNRQETSVNVIPDDDRSETPHPRVVRGTPVRM